jgi:aromatic ring hydroxylase
MATIKNARHERFAQALADGKSQIEAHGIAGFKAHRGNASLLAQDKNIVARMTELLAGRESIQAQATARAVEAAGLTKEWIIERLIQNVKLAAANEDYSPSNQALALLGKELGMFIERREVKSDATVRVTDEREELRKEIAADLAAPHAERSKEALH